MAILSGSGFGGMICSVTQAAKGYVEHFIAGLRGWRITHNGDAEFKSVISREQVGSSTFIPGFDGTGMKIWQDGSDWKAEFDKLSVRKNMTVYELIIEKIRSVNGAIVVSAGNGKIKSVELEGGKYTLEMEDKQTFVEHDLVRCQSWTGNNIKYYWVEVERIAGDAIIVDESEFEDVIPEVGDELVLLGNKDSENHADRQGAVYISASEDGLPRVDVLAGICEKTLGKFLKDRVGCIDHINDPDFPVDNQPHGYGHYGMNQYLKGTLVGGKGYLLREDGSGHIGGGAISWQWDVEKKKYVVNMAGNVVLTWDNLDEQTKENLAANAYEIRTSVEIIPFDSVGNPQIDHFIVEFYHRNGYSAAEKKMTGWIYEIKLEDDTVITRTIDYTDTLTMLTRSDFISYTFKTGTIVNDVITDILAEKTIHRVTDGRKGDTGAAAVTFELRPESPYVMLDANKVPKKDTFDVYFWKTIGANLPEQCEDYYLSSRIYGSMGQHIQAGYSMPTSWLSIPVQNALRPGEAFIGCDIYVGSRINGMDIMTIRVDGMQEGFNAPWLEKWNNNKTLIGNEQVVSVKSFMGNKNAAGKLTGVFQGTDVINYDGNKCTGIFGVVEDDVRFALDPVHNKYLFKGRVEAEEGFFSGTVNIQNGKILLNSDGSGKLANGNIKWDILGNTFFSGSIFEKMKIIEKINDENSIYLDFSTGFNLDISKLSGDYTSITVYLPSAADYLGAKCTIWFGHICTRVPHYHPIISIINNGYFGNMSSKTYVRKITPISQKKLVVSAMPGFMLDGITESINWYVDTPENVEITID